MKECFLFTLEEIGQALVDACLKKLPMGKYDFHYELTVETKNGKNDFTALVIYEKKN